MSAIAAVRYTIEVPAWGPKLAWRLGPRTDEAAARRALAAVADNGHAAWIIRTLEDEHGRELAREQLP